MYEASTGNRASNRSFNNSRNLRDDRDSFDDWLKPRELNSLLDALAHGRGGIHYDDFLQFAMSPEDGEKEPSWMFVMPCRSTAPRTNSKQGSLSLF